MNTWFLFGSMLFSGSQAWFAAPNPADELVAMQTLMSVMSCRGEASPLVRLACYDSALSPVTHQPVAPAQTGPAWQRAREQESKRTGHSTAFLVSEGSGDNPAVVITTPAIGAPPPRPILMLSCIDNITRLQIALSESQNDGAVRISADNDHFDVHWFLRENGYLLESSRGLIGIDEIKRLMTAQTLTVAGTASGFPRLTFNISALSQVIKPLRNACHW